MQYKLDPQYIQRRLRSDLKGSLIYMVVIGVVLAGQYTARPSIPDKSEAIGIGAVVLIFIIALSCKRYFDWKKWAANAKVFALEITSSKMIMSDSIGKSEMNIELIDSMKIQKRGNKIISLLIKDGNGTLSKYVGFINMDKLAEDMTKLLPKEKVKVAKWFHR